jgi:hypothetical protein
MPEQMKQVISASRRTDLPAFYYGWLQAALKAGEVLVPNPRFPNIRYKVDLRPENVHSIVLWSKNLIHVQENPMYLQNYNLYFQFTINSYSKVLEPSSPPYEVSMKVLEGLRKRYPAEQFTIRFDPVIIADKGELIQDGTDPVTCRLDRFRRLCRDLEALGMAGCRITTSYVDLYPQVRDNLIRLNIGLRQLDDNTQKAVLEEMAGIAAERRFNLYSCAETLSRGLAGIHEGKCIDGALLKGLFGGKVSQGKDPGQRAGCGCTKSRDIGSYDQKCGFRCQYCYSNMF